MCTGAEYALIAIATVGTAASVYSGARQRRAQRRQERAQRRMQSRQARRQRLEQLRAAQRKSAAVQASAASSGVLSSSGTRGGVDSIRTQAANNIAFINQIEALQEESRAALEQQRDISFQNAAFQGVTNLAAKASSFAPVQAAEVSNSAVAGSGSAAQDPFSPFDTTQQSTVPSVFG